MQIKIGLYQKTDSTELDGWRILCDQEKIPCTDKKIEDCPVIVCEKAVPVWLQEYMEQGGIAIVTGAEEGILEDLTIFVGKASLEFIDLSALDSAKARIQTTVSVFEGDGQGILRLHENRLTKLGMAPDEYPVLLYRKVGKGGLYYSGVPFSSLISVLGDTLRKVDTFSDYQERVTSVDKHLLLRAMRYMLMEALGRRGLPYVSLSYYPESYKSVFCFRVDVDGIYGENLKKISQAGKEAGIRMSFFVNRGMCEVEKKRLSDIDACHEIGNHAVLHNLYTDYEGNFQNVSGCTQWLNELGIKCVPGFVAPRGMWNYNLNRALAAAGMRYTSDFGFCIYGLPFYPYEQGKRMAVLQIPVNPFSVERACAQARENGDKLPDADSVSEYFERSIEEQYRLGMPVILYSHPQCFGPLAAEVMPRIQGAVEKKAMWHATLTELEKWWKLRDSIGYCAEYDTQTGEVHIEGDIPREVSVIIKNRSRQMNGD